MARKRVVQVLHGCFDSTLFGILFIRNKAECDDRDPLFQDLFFSLALGSLLL